MRIGIIGNRERERAVETLGILLGKLQEQLPGTPISVAGDMAVGVTGDVAHYESLDRLAANSDVVFSIGGDGTMLVAARAIMCSNPSAQLIGINVGKLGFLSENPPNEIDHLIRELVDDSLKVESRLMLDAVVEGESGAAVRIKRHSIDPSREGESLPRTTLNALNEIVVDNYGSTRMLTLEVYVSGALLGVMRADGIIVATPTGSTGYAVSAGGPIVEPTSKVMLLTPIAPHSLNVRPVIVPEGCTIMVRASSDETKHALVVADGQDEAVVPTPATITIQASQHRLQLLRRKERSYFDLLRHKLLWSMDQRDTGRY
jgi:NAD+ kinase